MTSLSTRSLASGPLNEQTLRSTGVWTRLGGSLGSGGPGMVVHSNAAGAEIVPDCDNIQSKDGCDQAAVCEDPHLCAPAWSRS